MHSEETWLSGQDGPSIFWSQNHLVKSKDSEARWPGLQILSMPFICCVTLSKSLNLSGLPFLYQRNETNSTALMGLCEG